MSDVPSIPGDGGNPKFEELKKENAKKKGRWAKIAGALVVVVLIVLKVAAKFGIGYGVTQMSINQSKYDNWSKEFKTSFVSSCAESTAQLIRAEHEEPEMKVVEDYCSCMANRIEGAHIVQTQYNKLTESEESVGERVAGEINQFLETPDGLKLIRECMDGAAAGAKGKKPVPKREDSSAPRPGSGRSTPPDGR